MYLHLSNRMAVSYIAVCLESISLIYDDCLYYRGECIS